MITKELFQSGTTGTPTSPVVDLPDDNDPETALAVQMEVTAIGATPTYTFIWEGSMDGTNWVAVAYITPASATEAVTAVTRSTVGVDILFGALSAQRRFKKYRVRVTANTNVTFRGSMFID